MFGGVPYYNRLIDRSATVRENIINMIASPGARLENVVAMYLNSEISKITNATLTTKMLETEIEQVKMANLPCYKYGFISRGGLDEKRADDMILIELRELYK